MEPNKELVALGHDQARTADAGSMGRARTSAGTPWALYNLKLVPEVYGILASKQQNVTCTGKIYDK